MRDRRLAYLLKRLSLASLKRAQARRGAFEGWKGRGRLEGATASGRVRGDPPELGATAAGTSRCCSLLAAAGEGLP
jgi:hypothetical protein